MSFNSFDYATYLEDYIATIENLPSEIKQIYQEITEKDKAVKFKNQEQHQKDLNLRKIIKQSTLTEEELNLKFIKESTNSNKEAKLKKHKKNAANPSYVSIGIKDKNFLSLEQLDIYNAILAEKLSLNNIIEEKIKLAERAFAMVDRHVKRITNDMEKFIDQDTNHYNSTYNGNSSSLNLLAPPSLSVSNSNTDLNGLSEIKSIIPVSPNPAGREGRQGSNRPVRKRPANPKSRKNTNTKSKEGDGLAEDEDFYCTCRQVSFGAMVACDGE
ncbi:hypothetical protein HK099_004391, partial [Clydaea vesicula]